MEYYGYIGRSIFFVSFSYFVWNCLDRILYYFNFVSRKYVKVTPDAEADVFEKLAPNDIPWWFRWAVAQFAAL